MRRPCIVIAGEASPTRPSPYASLRGPSAGTLPKCPQARLDFQRRWLPAKIVCQHRWSAFGEGRGRAVARAQRSARIRWGNANHRAAIKSPPVGATQWVAPTHSRRCPTPSPASRPRKRPSPTLSPLRYEMLRDPHFLGKWGGCSAARCDGGQRRRRTPICGRRGFIRSCEQSSRRGCRDLDSAQRCGFAPNHAPMRKQ